MMFDELLSVKKPFGKEEIELYGNEAAKGHLENSEPLNEKIASIAIREELNNEQIQRVVEESNTLVDLHKQGESFELAKTASVVLIIRKKPAADLPTSDYDAPPCGCAADGGDEGPGFKELFGVQPQQSELMSRPKKLHVKIIKLGMARDELAGKGDILNIKKESVLKELAKTAEAQYHEDPEVLSSVLGLTKIAFPSYSSKVSRFIDGYFQSKELIEKTAGIAPDNLISENLKKSAIIQNGSHKMLKKIETIKHIEDDIAKVKMGVIKLDEEIGKTKEELKAL